MQIGLGFEELEQEELELLLDCELLLDVSLELELYCRRLEDFDFFLFLL